MSDHARRVTLGWSVIVCAMAGWIFVLTSASRADRQEAIAKAKEVAALRLEKAEIAAMRERVERNLGVVTARVAAMEALLDSDNHGFAVLDHNGLVVEWNPFMEKYTGYTKAEMLGQDIQALMSAQNHETHAAGYAKIINDPKSVGKTYVVECELTPRSPEKKRVHVRVSARIVQPPNDGERYAMAFIDRTRRVVDFGEEK